MSTRIEVPLRWPWNEKLARMLPLFILSGFAICAIVFYPVVFVVPNYPSRPGNVPKSASLVLNGWNHFWQECWFDSAQHKDRYRICGGGRRAARPADGGAAISEDQLKIVQGSYAESAAHLLNGTVSIPQKTSTRFKQSLMATTPKAGPQPH